MEKFSSFLVVLLLMLTSFTAGAQEYPRGDVNQDGAVNISDVTCLISNLLNNIPQGDVSQDGVVSISDVTSLIGYLLSGSWPDDPVTPPDDGDWVDLGLPSGTIWATRNVGASAPEDYGYYFAWGETEPKDYYDYSTYKWCKGRQNTLTKYCTNSSDGYNGFVDGMTELEPEDDAACTHYPGGRMPSYEQIQELHNSCSWQKFQRNGVNGMLVTGPNGKSIFLPRTGLQYGAWAEYTGDYSYYWSRTLYTERSYRAYGFLFYSSHRVDDGNRMNGRTVRAVHASN